MTAVVMQHQLQSSGIYNDLLAYFPALNRWGETDRDRRQMFLNFDAFRIQNSASFQEV